tara:strand:- start:3784 stop:3900 length:117 start_codon:yes stop_codon:yes gene_type:complete
MSLEIQDFAEKVPFFVEFESSIDVDCSHPMKSRVIGDI